MENFKVIEKFFKKLRGVKMEESVEVVNKTLLDSLTEIKTVISELKEKIDQNKDGKITPDEMKKFINNPMSKRYLLVFLVIFVNIMVAIGQFYFLSKTIDVGTLLTLIVSTSTVLFGGWIENANTKVIREKEMKIDEMKDQLNIAFKNSIEKDSTINIQKNEIEHYKKLLEK